MSTSRWRWAVVALGIWGLASGPSAIAQTILHSFAGGAGDGAVPYAPVILSGSNLYGTTVVGGGAAGGVVFTVRTDGSGYANLHEFTGDPGDGAMPYASPALSGTALYGMTYMGGWAGLGAVFAVGTDGTGYTNLHEFLGGAGDGAAPYGSPRVSGTTLYGMTYMGGAAGKGVVFAIQTDGSGYTNLHEFTGGAADGALPAGSVTFSGTTLYGMTYLGGAGNGVIFRMNSAGTAYTNLHNFAGGAADGALPAGSLTLSGTTLYGMTYRGGASNSGVVFRIETDGTGYANLHTFVGGPGNGALPRGGLTLSGSTLYGATPRGGAFDHGALFRLQTDGTGYTNLTEFTGGPDGGGPLSDPAFTGTHLYGASASGGGSDDGVVFALRVACTLTVQSDHGAPVPAGTALYAVNSPVDARVASPELDVSGTTQYVCTGGAVAGLDAASYTQVSATNLILTMTNDAVLTWLWQTNCWLATGGSGPTGSVDVASGWFPLGSDVAITATPSNGWHFDAWTGDTGGCAIAGNAITAAMTRARSIVAAFAIDRHTLAVDSLYGAPAPSGTTTSDWNTLISASVASPVADSLTTQYVCTGWTGTGSVTGGSGTNTSFGLTADSTLTWQWKTQYLATATAGPNGVVAPAGTAWVDLGSNTPVYAATPVPGYGVDRWFLNGAAVQNGGTNFSVAGIAGPAAVAVTFLPPAAMPALAPGGGNYPITFDVTLHCLTAGATIWYTTDGTDPTNGSASVPDGGTVTVSRSLTLKAMATAPGHLPSPVASADYTLPDPQVAILSPTNGTLFYHPSALTVTVFAAATYGVAVVEVREGTNRLGTATTAPYVVVWTNAAVASNAYVLTAVAWDTQGHATTSMPVNVRVRSPIWVDAIDMGGGWKYLPWFGFFKDADGGWGGWIWHSELGWMYAYGTSPADIWMWSPLRDWVWTSNTSYPWFWSTFLQTWIYYYEGTGDGLGGWFYNLATGHAEWR